MIQPFGHMGPFDLLTEASLGGIVYPPSGPSNLTWDSVYTFDETSGNLIDQVGASDLNANGTPTYDQTLLGRKGIYYDAADERHMAQVHDPGTDSLVAFGVCSFAALAGTGGFMGGYDAADALDGWLAYRNTTKIEFHVRSSATSSLLSTSLDTILTTGQLYLVSVQVDRTATTARARITPRGGVGEQKTFSIAGVGTLSSAANHLYGFGSTPFLAAGVSVYYGGIKVGAGSEGASVLQNIHRALGWE